MPTVFYEAHPKMQAAIKRIVLILARGEQPSPDDADIKPAHDFEYVNYD